MHADHNVEWAGDWPGDPADLEIIGRAHKEGRVLVTLDKDFGELAIVRNIPHSGIIRLVGVSAQKQAEVLSFRARAVQERNRERRHRDGRGRQSQNQTRPIVLWQR